MRGPELYFHLPKPSTFDRCTFAARRWILPLDSPLDITIPQCAPPLASPQEAWIATLDHDHLEWHGNTRPAVDHAVEHPSGWLVPAAAYGFATGISIPHVVLHIIFHMVLFAVHYYRILPDTTYGRVKIAGRHGERHFTSRLRHLRPGIVISLLQECEILLSLAVVPIGKDLDGENETAVDIRTDHILQLRFRHGTDLWQSAGDETSVGSIRGMDAPRILAGCVACLAVRGHAGTLKELRLFLLASGIFTIINVGRRGREHFRSRRIHATLLVRCGNVSWPS
mmetsp:Transcript_28066/g.63268  ORF Transcript_28066/g.63268 Transcript_28066/m.63268 type:complete len:282 (-) Transcript_28066:7-852(-)